MNKQASPAFRQRAQGGFTLIELIVVIVILGILAATALPKFSDLSGDARAASLNAAAGSLKSVMAMTHGQALAAGTASDATGTVTMEGKSIAMVYGYPDATADAIATAAGLDTNNDYVLSTSSSTGTTTPAGLTANDVAIQPKKNPKAACFVKYTKATATVPASVDTSAVTAQLCL